jgi:Spy/CpxP family protein refolding chaperone
MAEEISLSDAQQDQIQDIFRKNDEKLNILRGKMHKQFLSIRSGLIDEINKILDDVQKLKFEAMIERYISQRKKEMKERSQRSKKSRNKNGDTK